MNTTIARRLPLYLAIAAALSPAMAPARDLYWSTAFNPASPGKWSLPASWNGTIPAARDGDNLHFQGSMVTNINDLAYTTYGSITFEAGASAFTLNTAGANIGLTGGIRNLSSNLQQMNFGTAGYVIAADQIWDGGSAGMLIRGGMDMHAALTLQNKAGFAAPASNSIGNDADDLNTTLTVRANSSYSTATSTGIGVNDGANGNVYVKDTGSTFAAGTDLVIGELGTGFMQVQNGATATSTALYFGRSGGSGTLNVTGAGSMLTTKTAVVTQGIINVANGGQIKATDSMKLADYANVPSTITVQNTGSLLQVTNGLTVGAGGTGQLNVLTGGTAAAGQLMIGADGTVNLLGGTLKVGSAGGAGTFNFLAGTLEYTADAALGAGALLGSSATLAAGTLLKADTVFQVPSGTSLILLGGNVQAQSFQVAAQGNVTVNVGSTLTGATVTNLGSLQLAGGQINGSLDNQGYMSGNGYIGGQAVFINRSYLDQTGFLELQTTTAFNNGTWNLQGGKDLTLRDTILVNYNTINIDGAKINGAGLTGGSFQNTASGTITGNGILQVPFQNDGRLIVQGGTVGVQYTLQNSGQILLNSADASVVGNTIVNTGRIEGLGQVGNAITNTGTINAKGGTLTLSSMLTNSGTVSASRDATLFLQAGMAPNAGKVQLSGGTLDTNGKEMTNDSAGTISGYGDVRSGLLTNNGRLLMSGGVSAIYSDLLSNNLSKIILSGNSNTTFYGKVDVQSGAELRVSTGSVATFFDVVQQRTGSSFTGQGSKRFEGGLSVGASPGLGTDEGDVEFGDDNVYLAEIGGLTACTLACGSNAAFKNSSYDKYIVAGNLSLRGTLKLTSWNGFVAQAGETFDLLDWGSMNGSFATIDDKDFKLAAGSRLDYSRLYETGEVRVTAVPEPHSYALLLAGLGLVSWVGRRRGRRGAR